MATWPAAALVTATLLLGGQAGAAPITFDFGNAPLGAATPFSLTSHGLTTSFASPGDPGAFEVSYNVAGTLPATYATFSDAFLTVGNVFGAAGSTLTITFSQAIHSLSLLFALDDPGNTTSLSAVTASGKTASATGRIASGFSYPEGRLTFGGGWFSTVSLSSDALDFSIDTIVVDTPEPASLLLTLGALPALVWLRRRRAA